MHVIMHGMESAFEVRHVVKKLKSRSSWLLIFPIIYRVSTIQGGAGLFPSTIWEDVAKTKWIKKNEWNETCNNKLVVTMIIWFPLLASPIEPKFIFNNYKYWKNKLWCLLPMKIPTPNQISEQRWISQNFVLLRGQKQFSHEHKWIRNFSQSVTIGGCRAFHNTKTNNVANKIVTTLFENNWVFSEIQTPWHLLKRGCTCQYDPIWPIFVHCHSICIVPSSKNCGMVQLF